MSDSNNTADVLDRADEDVLGCAVTDEALEAAAAGRAAPSAFTVGSSTYSNCCFCPG
jgi:hypothetical protein